ncbi:hypothetical protein [Acetobacter thailandicus]|uniref:Uncharacterized protein n=1 Tax=Acetobacter thailandicus TaxID=1502842 RepID=A0ABT3QCA4_9PROT|nr:hypothetical protein [Acetobacter thailandicus]MCX2562901.1 hypothetical protein [Acetobacter thailandicus]NHN95695.1 hypothetical protein [Acetobacter thailandicus]
MEMMSGAFARSAHGVLSEQAVVAGYQPPCAALRAAFAVCLAGTPVLRRDLSPVLMAELEHYAAWLQAALQPPSELLVAAWLKKLGGLVTNPPGGDSAAARCAAIFEVCGELAAGVWNRSARMAWVRQPPRNDYYAGARWPSPSELYTLLVPFDTALRRDAEGCRKLMKSLKNH